MKTPNFTLPPDFLLDDVPFIHNIRMEGAGREEAPQGDGVSHDSLDINTDLDLYLFLENESFLHFLGGLLGFKVAAD